MQRLTPEKAVARSRRCRASGRKAEREVQDQGQKTHRRHPVWSVLNVKTTDRDADEVSEQFSEAV